MANLTGNTFSNLPWQEGKDWVWTGGGKGTAMSQRALYRAVWPGAPEQFFVPAGVKIPDPGDPAFFALRSKYGNIKTPQQARATFAPPNALAISQAANASWSAANGRPPLTGQPGQVGGPPATSLGAAPKTDPYGKAITGEGIYQYENAQQQAEVAAAAAARQAANRGAYEAYGGALPAGFKDVYGDFAPDAQSGYDPLKVAANNPYSTTRQLDRLYGDPTAKAKTGSAFGSQASEALARLSARGAMGSGEQALQLGDIGYHAGMDRQKAATDFLNGISQTNAGFAGTVRDQAGSNVTSMQEAMKRLTDAGFAPNVAAGPAGASVANITKKIVKPKLPANAGAQVFTPSNPVLHTGGW